MPRMQHLRWNVIAKGDESFLIAALTAKGKDWSFDHDHDFPELFLMEYGSAIHHVNGKNQTLKSGDLVLIRAPDRHCFRSQDGEEFRFVNVAFSQATLDYIQQRYFKSDREFWGLNEELPATFGLSPGQRVRISASIEQLSQRRRTRFEIDRFLLAILGELENISALPALTSLPSWLRQACERIQQPEHLVKGSKEFVRLANRSPEHTARVAKQLTGKTPTEWVSEARMDYAARLLCITDREIVDVAIDCGIPNLGHFYTLFKKRYGCAPRQYRVRNRAMLDRTR
jgi:AraC family cel operon transcriptional repressor